MEATSLDGVGLFSAFSRSPVSGWGATIGMPRADLLGPVSQNSLILLLVFITLSAVSLLGAGMMARRILLPIERAAVASASGTVTELLSSRSGIREIDSVAESLRTSAEAREASDQIAKERQKRLMLATSAAGLGIFESRIDGDKAVWENDRMFEIMGRTRQQGPFSNSEFMQNVIAPEDRDQVEASFNAATQHSEPFSTECGIVVGGKSRILKLEARFLAATKDYPARFVGVAADITESRERGQREARLAAIAASSSDAIMGYGIDGTITAWNPAAERMFGWSAQEALGHHARIIAPPDRHAEQIDVLERMARGETFTYESIRITKAGQSIPVAIACAPILDETSKVVAISAVVRDFTERKRWELQVLEARNTAENRAREAEEGKRLLDLLLDSVPAGITIAWGKPDFPIFAHSRRAIELLGSRDAVPAGMPLGTQPTTIRLFRPDGSTLFGREELPIYRATHFGETVRNFETVIERADGTRLVTLSHVAPFYDSTGQIVGAVNCWIDITERKRDQEQREFLMRELTHRTKNLLAIVSAMARQTITTSANMGEVETKLLARVQGLALSQDMLVATNWQGASIESLATAHLNHFSDLIGTRIVLSGPPITLNSEAAQNIGLAMHELSTNAAKYGALSQPSGLVHIYWRIENLQESGRTFRMVWQESGGPPVAPPTRKGFGQTVVERLVARALDGKVSLDYAETGVVWSLSIGIEHIIETI